MKKLPYIIGIPFLAVVLVLGGAMLWRLKNQATTVDVVATAPRGSMPNALGSAGGSAPTNPFSALFGQPNLTPTSTIMPTPTPASAAAMNTDVNSVGDDGGAADFNSLNSQASGL